MTSSFLLNILRMFKNLYVRTKECLLTHKNESLFGSLLLIGVILRLKHYFNNCSLWTDEAWVAVSVTSRSLWDIVRGVEVFPGFSKPPFGFLFLSKIATLVFGNQEYALRFFSLVFGIAALFLFYRLLKRFKDPTLTLIAFGLFALSPSLIYYSAELKQYSLDLAVGLGLFLYFGSILQKPLCFWRSCVIGLIGAIVIWISNAALFILSGFGLITFASFLLQKKWRDLALVFWVYACWAVSFWFLYHYVLADMVTNQLLFQMWKGALLEAPVFSREAVLWMGKVFSEMFTDPLSFSTAAVAIPLFVLGVLSLVRKQKQYTLLFLLPVIITLLAAVFHKYPFRGRLLLFLFPGVMIFTIQGLLFLARSLRKKLATATIIVLLLCLCAPAIATTVKGFFQDYCREDTRDVLRFVDQQYQQDDFIFMNSAAQFPLWYYGGRWHLARLFHSEWAGFEKGTPRQGVKVAKFWEGYRLVNRKRFTFFRYEFNLYDQQDQYVRSLIRSGGADDEVFLVFEGMPFMYPVPGKRAWVLLAGASDKFENIIVSAFDLRFLRIKEMKAKGMSAYLYQVR